MKTARRALTVTTAPFPATWRSSRIAAGADR